MPEFLVRGSTLRGGDTLRGTVAVKPARAPQPRTLIFPEMPLIRDETFVFGVEYRTDYLIRAFSFQDTVTLMAAHVATVLQSARGWVWNEARVDLTASISCDILTRSLAHSEFDILMALDGRRTPFLDMGWQIEYMDTIEAGLTAPIQGLVEQAARGQARRDKARENQRRWLGI